MGGKIWMITRNISLGSNKTCPFTPRSQRRWMIQPRFARLVSEMTGPGESQLAAPIFRKSNRRGSLCSASSGQIVAWSLNKGFHHLLNHGFRTVILNVHFPSQEEVPEELEKVSDWSPVFLMASRMFPHPPSSVCSGVTETQRLKVPTARESHYTQGADYEW